MAVLLLFALFAGCTANPQDLAIPPKTDGGASQAANVSSDAATVLTIEEVSKHSTKSDCWMVIDNKVLDLSPYTAHPDDSYVAYCGKEATQAFNDKGGKGQNHSQRAFGMLDSFAIGQLGQPIGGQ